MILNILISLYGAILFISMIVSIYTWYFFRHNLIKNLVYFWLSGIISFIGQGVFQNLDFMGLAAFCLNSATVLLFLKIYSEGSGLRIPTSTYSKILFLSSFASIFLLYLSENFKLSSAVFCLSCFCVIIHCLSIKPLQTFDKKDGIVSGFRFLLLFDAIHFLDYPFVRTDSNLAVFGFSITLIFFFSFAVYVPGFIFRQMSLDYTRSLEETVAIRTHQLSISNRELTLALEGLKDAKVEIEHVLQENRGRLSTLVHDISNPIQIIFHNINSLFSNPTYFNSVLEEKKEKLEIAMKVVKQTLSEAKNTHSVVLGKTSIALSKIAIDSIIDELLSVFEEQIFKKSLRVDVDLSAIGKNMLILANEGWLRNQVLSNILSNAIKFSPPHSTIKIVGCVTAAGRVSISVIDSGIGISESKKNSLFDFQKMTTSLGTAGEVGTGLGLPIVKQYTELMGGQIFVTDAVPKGACFEIQLSRAA